MKPERTLLWLAGARIICVGGLIWSIAWAYDKRAWDSVSAIITAVSALVAAHLAYEHQRAKTREGLGKVVGNAEPKIAENDYRTNTDLDSHKKDPPQAIPKPFAFDKTPPQPIPPRPPK